MKKAIVIVLSLLSLTASQTFAQKNKVKFKEKRFEPVVKQNVNDYAGKYVGIDDTYIIEIEVGADGKLAITSLEAGRKAMLTGIELNGSRITARKVYEDGATARFEGFFADRVLNGDKAFGIMVEGVNLQFEDLTLTRIFYRLKQ